MSGPTFEFTPNPRFEFSPDSPSFALSPPQSEAIVEVERVQPGVGQQPQSPQIQLNRVPQTPVSTIKNNFITWLTATHPNAASHVASVSAKINKDASGGYKWEYLKHPEDYPPNTPAPKPGEMPPVKIRIDWKVTLNDGTTIDKTEYYNPEISKIRSNATPEEIAESLSFAILRTKGYIQLMKAPIKPSHSNFSVARGLIDRVAQGHIGLKRMPSVKSLHHYAIVTLVIHGPGNTNEFSYDLNKTSKNDRSKSRAQIFKKQASESTISDNAGKVTYESIKKIREVLKYESTDLITESRVRGLPLDQVVDGLKESIYHDKEDFDQIISTFRDQEKSLFSSFRKFVGFSSKPTFKELEKTFNNLIAEKESLKVAQLQTEQLLARAPDAAGKRNLENQIAGLKTQIEGKNKEIFRYSSNFNFLKDALESLEKKGKQLKTLEANWALQLGEKLLVDLVDPSLDNQEKKDKLNLILNDLRQPNGYFSSPTDAQYFYSKILTPSKSLLQSDPVGDPPVQSDLVFKLLFEIKGLNEGIVSGTLVSKRAVVHGIAEKIQLISEQVKKIRTEERVPQALPPDPLPLVGEASEGEPSEVEIESIEEEELANNRRIRPS